MKLRTVRGLLGTTLAIVVVTLIVLTVFWITTAQWEQGQNNLAACNDYNPCTSNRVLPDGSCITPPRFLRNGSDCSVEDQCYETFKRDAPTVRVKKYCTGDGQCLAPQQYCRGYCNSDDYCLNHLLPLRYDALQSGNITVFCSMYSCLTIVSNGFTSDCASWLVSNDTGRYTTHCLVIEFDPDNNQCLYRYKCAPPVLPTTEPPTGEPTVAPTAIPTRVPTTAPTNGPTMIPTVAPTKAPTAVPTVAPTPPTAAPTVSPTDEPTPEPTPELGP